MTSKSPEQQGRDGDLSEPSREASGSVKSPTQTGKLAQLREAISEIDQRHAEGESGFFDRLSGPSADDPIDDGPPEKVGPSEKVAFADEEVPSFADALSFGDDDPETPDFETSYAKAKKTAMNMLAMRDHSKEELRGKLLKREFLPEAVDELIVKLEKSKLLNDEEFAHRYVRAHRERRKLSRSVLRRELNKKGIAPDLISDAVDEVDGEEDLAREVAEKKAASTSRLDYEVRERRILGMLARRGFSSSICIKVTREVLAED